MMLFLFWLIRICCLSFFIVNLVVVDVTNVPSFLVMIFGVAASFNIYVWGLLAHETYKSLPSLFILFRGIQLLLILSTKCLDWTYLAVYAALDVIVFSLYVYDNRYQFILKEVADKNVKTIISRETEAEEIKTQITGKKKKKKR